MTIDPDHLSLTDFMDLPTLQEIQDSFAAVANVTATITDASGNIITQPVPTSEFLRRQSAIAQAEAQAPTEGPTKEGRVYVAPIMVNNQRLGTIRMSPNGSAASTAIDEVKLASLSAKFGLDARQIKSLANSLVRAKDTRAAAVQFLFLLANAIARLCYQEFQLRQRVDELTAVYTVTTLLSDARDLRQVLQRTVRVVAEVMQTKAAAIRLIQRDRDEMVTMAVHNLSPEYLAKGPVRLSKASIDEAALSPRGYEYVANMATDSRVQYPDQAQREGIVSMLSAGMRYKGQAIGALRVYTDVATLFNQTKIDLLKAIAAQAAAAIENARLLEETRQAEALEKQVQMAAEVQRRMVPRTPPIVPGIELASVYVPCYTLGGDLFDFIPLPYDNVGLVIADVSGKGVPASLIMASVRAALRAQVDNLYYLDEVIRRLNVMLCRDNTASDFVTLFYGVLDARNRRLTYCNAGHPPALLLREGKVIELGGENLVLGVDPEEPYTQSIFHLKTGDMLLLYTDGLYDAVNFEQERFGRQRILHAFAKGGPSADVVAQNMLWEMRRFSGLTQRTDDVTIIVAKVL
jgi:sigma-B regulation protein RsbU (phosphoserine phosphatase)